VRRIFDVVFSAAMVGKRFCVQSGKDFDDYVDFLTNGDDVDRVAYGSYAMLGADRRPGGGYAIPKSSIALDPKNGIDFQGYVIRSIMIKVLSFREQELAGTLRTDATIAFYVFGRAQTMIESGRLFAQFFLRWIGRDRRKAGEALTFEPDRLGHPPQKRLS
jgi:hypothetical protein